MSAGAGRVVDFIRDRIARIEQLLRKHGSPPITLSDELDLVADEVRWHIQVAGHPIYRIAFAADAAHPTLVGRWDLDGLRAAGLGDVADRVDTIREGRAS